jgi:cytochrome c5
MTLSAALVAAGREAAQAAESRNPEAVLAAGEMVYNVCTECHNRYISQD